MVVCLSLFVSGCASEHVVPSDVGDGTSNRIVVTDQQNRPRIVLVVTASGMAELRILDAQEIPRLVLGVNDEGASAVSLLESHGGLLASMSAEAGREAASLSLATDGGRLHIASSPDGVIFTLQSGAPPKGFFTLAFDEAGEPQLLFKADRLGRALLDMKRKPEEPR